MASRPPTLLIVDDSPEAIVALAAQLQPEYRIVFATNGPDALSLAESERPDLILLDVEMPGMNGYSILSHLKARTDTTDIPVMFVTAATESAAEVQGLILGAADYVTKPVKLPVLRARIRNLLARYRAEEQLRLAASVFEHSAEAILVADPEGRILDVNPGFCQTTGYDRDEVLGQTPRILNSGRHDREFFEQFWNALHTRSWWSGEIWNRMRNGEIRPQWVRVTVVRGAMGRLSHFVAIFSDINQLIQNHEQLERQAHYDGLTGLPNRMVLTDRLRQAIAQVGRSGGVCAVGVVDLDDFKPVNDRWGHLAGDAVLVEIARRLQQCARAGDTVSRWGGDEFVVLLVDLNDSGECTSVAERMLDAVARPIAWAGGTASVSASIGFAFCPTDGTQPEQLLRAADEAMYAAKNAGKNRSCWYRLRGGTAAPARHPRHPAPLVPASLPLPRGKPRGRG